MFTGIIQAVGGIARMEQAGGAAVVAINAGGLDMSDVAIGDSVACNGVCLTVARLNPKGFEADVSQETLRVTTGFSPGAPVNLEKSLRLADRLGGHLVSGHVDGIGEVAAVRPVDGNRELTIRFHGELGRFIARKGSVAVNGVSLTVNSVAADRFSINLIPHTLAVTNLKDLKTGGKVNLEVDLVARYVERMLGRGDGQ